MTNAQDIERLLDAWFMAGPSSAPDGSIDRALAAAATTRQVRPSVPWPWRGLSRPSLAGLVAGAGLLVVVAIVVSVAPWTGASGIGPDASTPGTSPSAWPATAAPSSPPSIAPATPAPTPPPSNALATPERDVIGETELFTSTRHRYTIRVPKDWKRTTFLEYDQLIAPAEPVALWITRSPKPSGSTLSRVAEESVPHRAEPDGCHWTGGGIIFIPVGRRPFSDAVIDGRPALVRAACGIVDAVIDLDTDVLIVSLRSGIRQPTGDQAKFDSFMETIEIALDRP